MATLDPKADVLRLLDRQPSDGSGPGYISAADVKTTCGNLYDQMSSVNSELNAMAIDVDAAQASYGQLEQLERARLQLLRFLVTPDYVATSTPTVANLQAELIQYLSVPGRNVVAPGATISGSGLGTALAMSAAFRSDIPVSWGNEVVTYKEGSTTVALYWWNGRNFEKVTVVPTGKPNLAAIRPNDILTTSDLTNFRVTTPAELLQYLAGDNAAWTAAAAGAKFTIRSVTGAGTALEYHWKSVDGAFAAGPK